MFVLSSLLFVNISVNAVGMVLPFLPISLYSAYVSTVNPFQFPFFCYSLHKTPSLCSLLLVIMTTSIFILVAQINFLFLFLDVACSVSASSCSARFPHPSFLNLLALTTRFCAVLFDYGISKSHLILICFLKFFFFLLSW